jgi:pimeloyl-ACP methyl ester carboxylesterase
VKRLWGVAIAAAVVLAALLVINAVVLGSETKGATVNAPAGEILELSSVDLQIVDRPASDPGRDGEGAPIVLLHCYACSLRWWQRLTPLLNANHRVVMVDLIGFGGSQKPKGGYSIGEQARAVAEALNRLGVEGAVMVGHSMGGEVATAVAESSSELVDRVAVIGTRSSTDEARLPLEARLTYAPVLGEALWRVRPDGLIRRGYEDAFAPEFDFEAAFDDPDQVVVDNRAMTYTSYERTADEADRFSEAGTVAARLTATGVPLLAVFGSEDQIVDSAAAAASFEAVPGAIVRTLDGVGHSPNLEAPEETAEALLRFAGAAPPPVPERRREQRPVGGGKGSGQRAGGDGRGGNQRGSGRRDGGQGRGSNRPGGGGGQSSGRG